uniref:Uncharacterized protein n=1 Tax=Rhodosorus marinus TaxID=101924 RepID=A0A7S3EB53_9RHOD|mmetsp:Transcript_22009/g.89345  ORF Transcript_22009/g.89345 Transcript_22009/m.89345 type:complete len:255 (+) Transcript_22009:667-1431(+)|eukprot:CAMPEP_0113960562 /NCGR_PEP_ID=MMETSP0011_2-20120614/4781_1 /TAXON_ID=101924 /ORGANISM="Rhodosorus marinus" /LENGTH=254 /DNA_ID=CAMNT_0000972023 /DNA_START=527 /DNA_END=1291 /DNA_ORIENTATION=- /assembly_acc=CAM_ASM_000156
MTSCGFVVSNTGLTLAKKGLTCGRPQSCAVRKAPIRMSSSGDSEVLEGPFKGNFGDWYLTKGDVIGVRDYRFALLGAAVSAAIAAGIALGVENPPLPVVDALYLVANGFLGLSLWKIHIYMKPMHNLLKALWGVGTAGAVAALFLTGEGLAFGTYDQTLWMLATGWTFVAMTGLFFKEGICFNRQEAWGLMVLTPILTGGHFLHLLPAQVERGGLGAFAAMFLFFAYRKFEQPATDDLGDKSVFDHLERQQEAA